MVKQAGSFAEFAKHYDLDVPEALELELMKEHIKSLAYGQAVYLPVYDMSGTAKRTDNVKLAKPSKIIISEGLFTLTEKVVDAFDFKIYVDVSTCAQKERFYKRASERGLGDSADEVYQNASNKAITHIHPTASKADIILSGEADRTAYRRFINRILALIEEVYYNN
jgi:uridine kinase